LLVIKMTTFYNSDKIGNFRRCTCMSGNINTSIKGCIVSWIQNSILPSHVKACILTENVIFNFYMYHAFKSNCWTNADKFIQLYVACIFLKLYMYIWISTLLLNYIVTSKRNRTKMTAQCSISSLHGVYKILKLKT